MLNGNMKKAGLLVGSVVLCAGLWLAFHAIAARGPEAQPRPPAGVAATQAAPSLGASAPADVDLSTAGLDAVRNAARRKAADEGDVALFRATFRDPKEFVKLRWSSGMGFAYTRKLLGPEAAPVLARMLRDNQYKDQWYRVAEALGYVGDDAATVDALLEYIRRPEDWSSWDKPEEAYYAIMGKIRSLEWIGRIGGEKAEAVLKEALEADGAAAMARVWAQSSLPKLVQQSPTNVAELIRGRAAKGLIFTGKRENIDLAMSVYEKEHAQVMATGQRGQLYSGLVDAAAAADYIADHGNKAEAFFELNGSSSRPDTLGPYLEKRSWRKGKAP